MPVKTVQSMGWTRRTAAVSVLLAMDKHRAQAGQRLLMLREARGWTQEDLAREAELSVKTVSRYENGKHDGRRATIRSLARALEVSEVELVGESPLPLVPQANGDGQLSRIEHKLDELLALSGASPSEANERWAALMREAARRKHERHEGRNEEEPPRDVPQTGT